jgi:hypothetical protein
MIDCFTKILKMKVLGKKNMVAVTETINKVWGKDTTPEEVITDNEMSYTAKYSRRCVVEEE